MPVSTRKFRRSVRTLRAMPRSLCMSVKRRTPMNASRSTIRVQRSPRTSIARNIEQFSSWAMGTSLAVSVALRNEGAPDNDASREISWGYVHELDRVYNGGAPLADDASARYRVDLTVPQG